MIRAFAGIAAVAGRVPLWLATRAGSPAARRHERKGYATLARGFGMTVELVGSPQPGGTLFVANHISWADIPVLGAALDARFVAKTEVARWPVVGALARRIGTVFVDRERRRDSGTQADAMRARLAAGGDVILFPEGTTADGTALLAFHSSLFAAADAAARVQPLAIAYRQPDGAPLSPERLRAIAWIDDDALFPNAFRVSRHRTLAQVHCLAPLDPAMGRKALASAARAAIAAELGLED